MVSLRTALQLRILDVFFKAFLSIHCCGRSTNVHDFNIKLKTKVCRNHEVWIKFMTDISLVLIRFLLTVLFTWNGFLERYFRQS